MSETRTAIVSDTAASLPTEAQEGGNLRLVPMSASSEVWSTPTGPSQPRKWYAVRPTETLSTSAPSPGDYLK